MSINKLIHGDNLEIMKSMESESIDLIYLDPPFFSNRNYEVIWGDKGEIRSFQDRWAGGIDHYIAWLKERVEQMHRLLKPTGSIFLHCDWHADAYIRVDILDKIFGNKNFLNDIRWKRTTTHNDNKRGKQYGRVSDTIFFYAKNIRKFKFIPQFERYTSDYMALSYNKTDPDGRRFKASDLSAANPGHLDWNGILPPKGRYWAYSKENLDEFEQKGLIYYSDKGKPYLKNYLDEMPGCSVDDIWINCVFKNKAERVGYPTQKPEALIDRIIKSASKQGDIILDPFVGGGTTVVVADRLQRRWIGIDQSVQAIKVTEMRLNKQVSAWSLSFSTQLYKYDYDVLRYSNAFEFETFIIQQVEGTSNVSQRRDFGIDGKLPDNTPLQVKRSENIGRNVIDNFLSAVQRSDQALFDKNINEKRPVGYIIAFSFGKGAIEEVARLKNKKNIIIELLTVDKIVPISKKPSLTLEILEKFRDERENSVIEFIATGNSSTGIEFYSWDFAYNESKGFNPDVFYDKIGNQTMRFKAGVYNIAVKVYDIDGLEGLEVLKLKVNGGVKKVE